MLSYSRKVLNGTAQNLTHRRQAIKYGTITSFQILVFPGGFSYSLNGARMRSWYERLLLVPAILIGVQEVIPVETEATTF